MYRRILVPVDGSETSTRGLSHAIGLAKDSGARLRLVNVLDEAAVSHTPGPYALSNVTALLGSMREAGLKALDEASALARKSGVEAEDTMIDAQVPHVSDSILAEVRKWRADLIVMGTHGRRGLNRLLLGSDAERVLRDASVPVLLVRSAATKRRRAKR